MFVSKPWQMKGATFNLFLVQFNHILFNKHMQWGWATSSHNISYGPSPTIGGGRVARWCCVNFQCWGVLLIWMRVGQGPTALAVSAGGCSLDIFLSSIISLFFLPLS